ncbi:MAG: HEAT repeat domain-containing protein [Promethearchaeota archaeon]
MSKEWHEKNAHFNALIKQLFHDRNHEKRAEAARQLGFLRDGRAVNLLCRALKNEYDDMVINRIIEALGLIGDGRATLGILDKLNEELSKPEIERDNLKIIFIIESLMRIKDKRALSFIGQFLDSTDDRLKTLARKAFNEIEPNWRIIIEKEQQKKSIQEIFKVKL